MWEFSEDHDKIRQLFKNAGFATDVRLWYQETIVWPRRGEEYYHKMVCTEFDKDPKIVYDEAFKAEIVKLWDAEMIRMQGFEMCFILAFKD